MSSQSKQVMAIRESSCTHSSMEELSVDDDIYSSIGKRSTMQLDSESENEHDSNATNVQPDKQPKEEKNYKRFKLNKTKEDGIPLPDPFDLPKNFRPDVASALASGRMTLETNRFFLSTVAGAMFTHKLYPTSDDYMNVARSICSKYPFMKSPTGKPYVSLIS